MDEMEFVTLRNDLLFHMVFSKNEKALKGLLSVLLNIPVERIAKPEILNPMQYSDVIDTKLTVLDLKVHLDDGGFILVEMQVRKFLYWINRTVVYLCRQVADQAHDNFDYGSLEPVIQISILDYSLFPEYKRFYKRNLLRDDEGHVFTDKIQFCVMDLSAMDDATQEQIDQGLVEWAKAFKAESWAEINGIENNGVKEAAKTMEMIMSNPTQREWIRMRRDAEMDHRTEIRAEREIGAKNAHFEDAMRMKQENLTSDLIARVTGLSLAEIEAL